MRKFLLKTVIIVIAFYILFKLTIGHHIDNLYSKLNSFSSQHQRIELKQKILSEIKKGTEKEEIFSEDERVILSNFFNKILKELDINKNKNN
tara:strand:+ start:107 stop:382 length:276 start_codon:yes stop_codon:yes gene_type:complete